MVKSIRVYLDFLYRTGRISREELQYWKDIFKIKKKTNNHIHNNINPTQLIEWIKQFKRSKTYKTILELLYYSGARLSEIIKMIKEFNENNLVYFEDKGFCRYGLFWHRGRKRCDWIYIPKEYIPSIRKLKKRIGKYDNIRDNLYDRYKIKPKLYRKLHYQICRESGIDKEICDFFQSRISNLSIGDIHYDNLLKRADNTYEKILQNLRSLLS